MSALAAERSSGSVAGDTDVDDLLARALRAHDAIGAALKRGHHELNSIEHMTLLMTLGHQNVIRRYVETVEARQQAQVWARRGADER